MPKIPLSDTEKITKHYKSALDSVNLLNSGKPSFMSNDEWLLCVRRNVDHLKIMLNKDFWSTQDLKPLHDAIILFDI